jgi:putative salt-induced outer membrane protein YdiY
MRIGFPAIASVILLFTGTAARGQDEAWVPPEVRENGWDWVRLNSGEWLGGEIIRLRDTNLEFDSDELDELEIDLDDVAEFRSPRILTWGFEDRIVATGPGTIRGDVVRIRALEEGGETREFRRRDLISIIEGFPSEWNFWSVRASLNFTTASGNTNRGDLAALSLIRRETTRSRVDLEYTGNYSETESEITVDNHRGDLSWNVLVKRGFFVSPVLGELYTDRFQNIELRSSIGAGVGVYLVRNGDTDLYVQLGGGYQRTNFQSVEAGEDRIQRIGAVVPSVSLETDITGNLELDASYTVQIGVPDTKQTNHHAKALFSLDLLGDVIDLTLSLQWDRNEDPKKDADGNRPERDDFRTAFGLGVEF